ncbi:FAD-binding oxidoreductase [Pedobacter punctiformis]|uniref:FAD-dependent oxidoreductase n=1 Tax=Pedobacter punctiformis TaxID=3004097 RepID=A0ABT4LBM9_9SPHI|nr:FAD-dependent oxidoreductase [Pedobacter sp. HCMS5-2]MCZ4245325.1 FAD-dependent oxidoreductase [Pedobacter sp. HCMS5-2]
MRFSSLNHIKILIVLVALLFFSCNADRIPEEKNIINDVTQLNPIKVNGTLKPKTSIEIINAVKNHNGPISIGGGRFSQGGQTATQNTLQIDMRKFNHILNFSREEKEITVQAGIRWWELIQFIDRYDLSVKIMQTYANFTVGGSLSVNVHGRYVGQGPIISSVKSFKIILADGRILNASREENREIFYSAIGGYGGIGVISEVTLFLTDNCKVELQDSVMDLKEYKNFFMSKIRNKPNIIFHNADIYPSDFEEVRAVSYVKTDKNLTVKDRLKPNDENYALNRFALKVVSGSLFGKWIRHHIIDPLHYTGKVVEWRNYEATYDINELEPSSRKKSTYVLQEYFIPVEGFESFLPKMLKILKDNKVNVLNISIRHANIDEGTYLAWAKKEAFAFVIYYKQGVSLEDKTWVKKWTRSLIDASLAENGSYYLPYQIQATKFQFERAYPNYELFFSLKRKYDPEYKFRNKLFDAYYIP